MTELFAISSHLNAQENTPCVLATLVRVQGSSYRRVGARSLIGLDGKRIGSISGGCLEEDLVARAILMIREQQRSQVVTYDTTLENETVWGVGMGCHGVVDVCLELIESVPDWVEPTLAKLANRQPFTLEVIWGDDSDRGTRWSENATGASHVETDKRMMDTIVPSVHVVIFGAGDDAQPLVQLAQTLNWQTTVWDVRSKFANRDRFPDAGKVLVSPAESAPSLIDWDDRTVAIVMTHHYRFDLPLLKTLLKLNLTYLGILGPSQRGERLMRDAGFEPNPSSEASTTRSPVGLDLGGDGPAAVALSIVSEIQAHFHGRNARPLHLRTRPIHAS